MATRHILLTGCFKYTKEQIARIEQLGYEVTFIQNELEELSIDVSKFDTVICNGLFLHNDISKFTNLKLVQATSAGLERLPLEYMNTHGIKYYNARGVYSIPMAEWVVMFILNIYKSYPLFLNQQKEHIWNKNRNLLELTNKTVTIVGYGSVGREIAKRLKPFGVTIQVVDIREVQDEYIDSSFLLKDLKKAISNSDINIISIAYTPDTHHIINQEMIDNMKNQSVLINVARGALINQEVLINNIDKFMGVGLDVYEKEPLDVNSPLWNQPNVLLTPHNSFVSDQVNQRMFEIMMENIQYHKVLK